jgi:hypothetical protein
MEFSCNEAKITNPNEIVNKFNDFFTNVGSELAAKIPTPRRTFPPISKVHLRIHLSCYLQALLTLLILLEV